MVRAILIGPSSVVLCSELGGGVPSGPTSMFSDKGREGVRGGYGFGFGVEGYRFRGGGRGRGEHYYWCQLRSLSFVGLGY